MAGWGYGHAVMEEGIKEAEALSHPRRRLAPPPPTDITNGRLQPATEVTSRRPGWVPSLTDIQPPQYSALTAIGAKESPPVSAFLSGNRHRGR